MKRIISAILVLALLFVLPCGFSLGETDGEYNGLSYSIREDGTVAITDVSYTAVKNDTLSIPANINGRKVTRIEEKAVANCSAKEIIIPSTVQEIGFRAFEACNNVTSITIPESVTLIDAYVFLECEKLERVIIKNGGVTLYANPFNSCGSLKEISIPESSKTLKVIDGILYNVSEKRIITCLLGRHIQQLRVPDGILMIGTNAFNAASISEIILPTSLTSINSYAFYNCDNLRSIVIPENVTKIGEGAFRHCDSLHNIEVRGGAEIGNEAFANCVALMNVDLGEKTVSLESEVFAHCSNLSYITIPGSVKTLDVDNFEDCTSLKRIKLCEGVESMTGYWYTYSGYFDFTIEVPNTLKEIKLSDSIGMTLIIDENPDIEKYCMQHSGIPYYKYGSEPQEPMNSIDEVIKLINGAVEIWETDITFYCTSDLMKTLLTECRYNGYPIKNTNTMQTILSDAGLQRYACSYDRKTGRMNINMLYRDGYRIYRLWSEGKTNELSTIEKTTLETALSIVDKAKAECQNELELELYIHDYICSMLEAPYKLLDFQSINFGVSEAKAPESNERATGTIKGGKADCEGYADLFYLLSSLAGLETRYIVGALDGTGHAWNAVKLDGEWYFVDVGNDDYTNNLFSFNTIDVQNHYLYFNMGADIAENSFKWDNRFSVVDIANTNPDMRYYTSEKLAAAKTFETISEVKDYIQNKKWQKGETAHIQIDTDYVTQSDVADYLSKSGGIVKGYISQDIGNYAVFAIEMR